MFSSTANLIPKVIVYYYSVIDIHQKSGYSVPMSEILSEHRVHTTGLFHLKDTASIWAEINFVFNDNSSSFGGWNISTDFPKANTTSMYFHQLHFNSPQNESLRWIWWCEELEKKGYCYNDTSNRLLKIKKKITGTFSCSEKLLMLLDKANKNEKYLRKYHTEIPYI